MERSFESPQPYEIDELLGQPPTDVESDQHPEDLEDLSGIIPLEEAVLTRMPTNGKVADRESFTDRRNGTEYLM